MACRGVVGALLDWSFTRPRGHVPIAFLLLQADSGLRFCRRNVSCRRKRPHLGMRPLDGIPVVGACRAGLGQLRRVSTKFWPAWLVQLSWLIETRRQLNAIGDWRISDVPLISIEVWLVKR